MKIQVTKEWCEQSAEIEGNSEIGAGCPPRPCAASLPDDVERCNGVGYQEDDKWGWREGCETCLRRTAERPKQVLMMAPPAIIAFECEFLIEPDDQIHP